MMMGLPKLNIHSMDNLLKLGELYPIVLGSGSPRRKDLLSRAGISFTILTADIPEDIPSGEAPDDAGRRLALAKANAVVELISEGNPQNPAVVIAADTIVWHAGVCLGKPDGKSEAREMLHSLRGETHRVFTAVAFALRLETGEVSNVTYETAVASTAVTFKSVSDDEIEDYLETGDPLDKAGAYGAQELGAFLVDHIDGELDTVIGFPLSVVDDLAGILLARVSGA